MPVVTGVTAAACVGVDEVGGVRVRGLGLGLVSGPGPPLPLLVVCFAC